MKHSILGLNYLPIKYQISHSRKHLLLFPPLLDQGEQGAHTLNIASQ